MEVGVSGSFNARMPNALLFVSLDRWYHGVTLLQSAIRKHRNISTGKNQIRKDN